MQLERTITLAALMAATAISANAARVKPIVVAIHTADGKDAGTVTLRPGKKGAVNVKTDLKNLPPRRAWHSHSSVRKMRSTRLQVRGCPFQSWQQAARHKESGWTARR